MYSGKRTLSLGEGFHDKTSIDARVKKSAFAYMWGDEKKRKSESEKTFLSSVSATSEG